MNDAEFFNNFKFIEYVLTGTHNRDNTHGVDIHFLGFMKRGRGILLEKGKTIELNENDFFYIPKGCKYRSTWIGDDTVIFDSIGFYYFPSEAPNGYALQKIKYDEELIKYFLPLSQSKEISATSIGTLYTLLGRLSPVLEEENANKAVSTVELAQRLMKEDPQKSIPYYADACDVSESLFYTYFKDVLGETPNTVRNRILCEKAIHLLTTTDISIEEICDQLGFSSSSYFRKILYSYTNKTPTQIRKTTKVI